MTALLARLPRVALAHLPTPLVKPARLSAALGVDLWIKRDDATGGAEAGNKIRKLEWLLADAVAKGADTVITCGGLQSNHARATALCAASLGLSSILYLRTPDPAAGAPPEGNVLLDRLVGAEIRLITPEQYRDRDRMMAEAAGALAAQEPARMAYVIPEGGSNGRGALGYVRGDARGARAARRGRRRRGGLRSLRPRLRLGRHGGGRGPRGGALPGGEGGAPDGGLRRRAHLRARRRAHRGRGARPGRRISASPPRSRSTTGPKGPAYAVSTPEQRAIIVRVARESGLVLDPVYTGKAFAGLVAMAEGGEIRGARVLFIHTGGLPGLLAQGALFA